MNMLSISETAKIMNVTRQRVWQLVDEKQLPATRVGNVWAIKLEDVRAYMAEKTNEK